MDRLRAWAGVGFLAGLLLTMVVGATAVPPADPILYGTYLGAEAAEYGRAIATDPAGNLYVAGETQSVTFPTTRASWLHGIDVYVAKFNATSGAADYILWFNALTLFAEDYAYGLAVGPDGSAYVVGDTRSDDFCALFGDTPGFDTTYNGGGDAFVLKVKPDGSGLDYCTFIGGSEADVARAIALHADGRVTITGGTWSDTDFPLTPDAYDASHNGLRDAFVLQLDATGTELLYATYLGGSGQEEGVSVAVTGDGETAVTGWTFSSDFPTTPQAYDASHNGSADMFVVRLDAAGAELLAATYLGAELDDRPIGIAVDAVGQMVVAGYTYSPNFPTTPGAWDRQHDGAVDATLTSLSPAGARLVASTFLGGAAEDWAGGLVLDDNGRISLTGRTWSEDFPTTPDALSKALNGGRDGFVAQLSQDGGRLLYASYIGGSDWDDSLAVTGGDGWLALSGATRSADFPVTANAHDTAVNGDYDIFVLQLATPPPADHTLFLPAVLRQ
ncbi:MAG: SBBP repeat-containing protein [Chloroflexi bacterium]|nr:SBBP repeat-containing protein [Chloroflexota bacterium]